MFNNSLHPNMVVLSLQISNGHVIFCLPWQGMALMTQVAATPLPTTSLGFCALVLHSKGAQKTFEPMGRPV